MSYEFINGLVIRFLHSRGHCFVQFHPSLEHKLQDENFMSTIYQAVSQNNLISPDGEFVFPYSCEEMADGTYTLREPTNCADDAIASPPRKKMSLSPSAEVEQLNPVKTLQKEESTDLCTLIKGLSPFPKEKVTSAMNDVNESGRSLDDDLGVADLSYDNIKFSAVQIYNIPPAYYNIDIFKNFLTETLIRHGLIEGGKEVFSKIGPYEEESESIVIEFIDAKLAEEFFKIEDLMYIYNRLEFKRVLPKASAVKISNISPGSFNVDIFKVFLTETVKRQGLSTEGEEVMKKIGPYDKDTQSIVIEFIDSNIAERFSAIKDLMYLYCKLELELVHENQKISFPSAPIMPSSVRIQKIPPTTFNMDIFKVFLTETVKRQGLSTEGEEVLKKIGPYDKDTQSIVIEFIDSNRAERFSTFKDLMYLYCKLELELVHENQKMSIPINAGEEFTPLVEPVARNEGDTDLAVLNVSEDVIKCGENEVNYAKDVDYQASDEEWQDQDSLPELSTSLRGGRATELFLQECKSVMSKGVFRATTKAFETVSEALREVHFIDVYPSNCRRKWKSLSDMYRRERKNPLTSEWEYRQDMAFLKGEPSFFKNPPARRLASHEMSRSQSNSSPKKVVNLTTPKTFLQRTAPPKNLPQKGAIFYDRAVCYLIKLRTEMHAKFDSNSYRNATLWEQISNQMMEAGHSFTAKQCEDKMDRLMDSYKTFEENRSVTGNKQVQCDYYDEMNALMGDWVNVHPQATLSMGCMATKTKKERE